MEETQFRTASQVIFFELQAALKWYLKRSHNEPQKQLINSVIEAQLIMLSPFCPHLCEETWEAIGKNRFISTAAWPVVHKQRIHKELNIQEEIVGTVLSDIGSVLKLIKKEPQKITLFVSLPWKYKLFEKLSLLMEETKNPKILLQQIMEDKEMKKYGNDISKFLPRLVSSGKITPALASDDAELATLHSAKTFRKRVWLQSGNFESSKLRSSKSCAGCSWKTSDIGGVNYSSVSFILKNKAITMICSARSKRSIFMTVNKFSL